jgi:hypothetical protein
MIETAKRSPSEQFARHCDDALQADGALVRLWPIVSRPAAPAWFRPWLEVEETADALRTWEPLMIPGLLQTEDYARAILSGDIGVTSEQIEEQVAARMQRQSILTRVKPPLLWFVLDEAVPHRPVGNPAVMAAQLHHLLEVAKPSGITIQLLPFSAFSTTGLAGGFVIAHTPGAADTAYVESAGILGRVTERPEDIRALIFRYEGIRSEALSQRESLELVKETVRRWTS